MNKIARGMAALVAAAAMGFAASAASAAMLTFTYTGEADSTDPVSAAYFNPKLGSIYQDPLTLVMTFDTSAATYYGPYSLNPFYNLLSGGFVSASLTINGKTMTVTAPATSFVMATLIANKDGTFRFEDIASENTIGSTDGIGTQFGSSTYSITGDTFTSTFVGHGTFFYDDGNQIALGFHTLTLTDASFISYAYPAYTPGVPEPSAWALTAVGLFALGGALRRRRRVSNRQSLLIYTDH